MLIPRRCPPIVTDCPLLRQLGLTLTPTQTLSLTLLTLNPNFLLLMHRNMSFALQNKKGKGSPYSIAEHRVPELIPVLGS